MRLSICEGAWPRLREFRSYHQVFKEQVSAVSPQQGHYAREGDVLVVTKLDHLARSVPHLCAIGFA
jgi:DNA invertase Pin-like site-specific DNA recombinase